MKSLLKITALFAVLVMTSAAFSQKPKVLSGNPQSLKKIKTWDIDVVAENPEVHKHGKMEAFMDKRVKEYNENGEEDNMGDNWKAQWLKNFDNRYNKKFCILSNKNKDLIAKKVSFSNDDEEAEGKIIIAVNWIYLGYVNPFGKQPSKVTTTISFVDNDGKELLKIKMVESPGAPGMFTAAAGQQNAYFGNDAMGEISRINESFAKCGKDLAGWLAKKAYK